MDTRPLSQPGGGPKSSDPHAELPFDPDVDVASGRPIHLHWRYVYVVALGGALGTAARYGGELLLPVPAGLPLPTLIINLAGAFLLGALLEGLLRRGPERGWLRLARLHFGTGFLGAFTTYSAFSMETLVLLQAGGAAAAVGYALATLLGGAVCTTAGIWVAAKRGAA